MGAKTLCYLIQKNAVCNKIISQTCSNDKKMYPTKIMPHKNVDTSCLSIEKKYIFTHSSTKKQSSFNYSSFQNEPFNPYPLRLTSYELYLQEMYKYPQQQY